MVRNVVTAVITDTARGRSRNSSAARALRALLLIGGLSLAVLAAWHGIVEQRRYVAEARTAAADYARDVAAVEYRTCRTAKPERLRVCLADAKRAFNIRVADNRRDYADLVAQQRSALWTGITGAAAILGMIVSIVGVWLVYATFKETQETARQAMRQADEAERNTMAFITRERGWLICTRMHVPETDGIFKLSFKVLNMGTAMLEVDGIRTEIREDASWPDTLDGPHGDLRKKLASGDDGLVHEHLNQTRGNSFFVAGYIRYRTLTLQDRRTHFHYEIRYHAADPTIEKWDFGGTPWYEAIEIDEMWRPVDS